MFNEKQKVAIAKHLKEKLKTKRAKGYEIVITVLTLAMAGKISEDDILPLLVSIFEDKNELKKAIAKSYIITDDDMISSILKEIESNE